MTIPLRGPSRVQTQWLVGLLAIGLPAMFWLTTGQVWEDFLITFRHAQNWVDGAGLTYNVGERVHGFTSPINVALPALAQKLLGDEDFHRALAVYTAVSIAVLTAGLVHLARTLWDHQPEALRWTAAAGPALALLQFKTIAFATNGQEAGFLVGFLALGLVGAMRGLLTHARFNGLVWGALLWTRPDAPVYIIGLYAAHCLLHPASPRDQLRPLLRAVAWATAVYGPWFAAMWIYYGSPIPHTVLAKSISTHPAELGGALNALSIAVQTPWRSTYFDAGGWPEALNPVFRSLGLFTCLYWLLPTRDRLGRACSVVCALFTAYLTFTGTRSLIYPWYCPPAGLFGALTITLGLAHLLRHRLVGGLAPGLTAALALLLAWQFSVGTTIARIHQREIEYGTRAEVGKWLATHVPEDEEVYLEPIGYIGYYSGRRILDFPGLVSPRIRELREHGTTAFLDVAAEVQPRWFVIRNRNRESVADHPGLAGKYGVAVEFDALPALARYGELPMGYGILLTDRHYVVLRRLDDV